MHRLASTASAARPETISASGEELARIHALYDQGLYVQAWNAAAVLGDAKQLQGTRERLLVARIAAQLGAPKLSSFLVLRAWKAEPRDAEAIYYRAVALQRRGPLGALRFLWSSRPGEDSPPEVRADLLLAEASLLGWLRDFGAAEAAYARAEALAPDRPWAHVEKAHLLVRQDRTEEALVHARRALELGPGYRPAIQMLAHTLVQHGRDDEALALLQRFAPRLESPSVCVHLAALLRELARPREALQWVERAIELSPLAERAIVESLSGELSETHYACGDVTRAIECAELAGGKFFPLIGRRMAAAADTGRVELPVPWVRQNHVTCAPATLTSIARLWGKQADHLQVAEAICYDGTPSHSERRWAEENGWRTRAFTLTWDAAVALLDRGVAFTLATSHVGSSHLRAIVGYDARRRTLLARDPSSRWRTELDVEGLLERHAATGPRGMAMIPRERGYVLDGLQLPDAPLYDLLDALESALERHDRASAAQASASLASAAPEHRITLLARRILADYDGNPGAALTAVQQLAQRYPKDPVPRMEELKILATLGRRAERLLRLREIVDRGAADPHFWHALAVDLRTDAREREYTGFLLRRFIQHCGGEAAGYATLADVFWDLDRREEALRLYRFAASLSERDEGLAHAYFLVSVHLGSRDTALEFLGDRFRRFGHRSGWPARTFFDALERSGRTDEAYSVLEQALALRPDDGALLLFAAECFQRAAHPLRAAELLAAARGRARHNEWLRAAAGEAESRGDLPKAIELWRALLEIEPLAMDAHAAVAHHLAGTAGVSVALTHLEEACSRFNHHLPLHQLWITWLREHDLEKLEQVLAHLAEVDPADAWTRRERALLFSITGRPDQALAELEIARSLDPASSSFHSTLGIVLARSGRVTEARDAYRASLRRDVDQPGIIENLIVSQATRAERVAELEFVRLELERQLTLGGGVEAWFELASGTVGPDALGARVAALHSAKPDLLATWLISSRHLGSVGAKEDAAAQAREMTARFPFAPVAWVERAACGVAVEDADDARRSLERAVEINPAWPRAAGELAELLERQGDIDRAREVLERVLVYAPREVSPYGRLAVLAWRQGRREEALARLEAALAIEPNYEFAWTRYAEWTREADMCARGREFARELARRRNGVARAWLGLARILELDAAEEALEALQRAIELESVMVDAHDLRAFLLSRLGRHDEALAACRPPVFGEHPAVTLRGRAAWVEAQRGNVATAIMLMQAAVSDSPDYFWGHLQLYTWHSERGDGVAALAAAKRLAELAPNEADSHTRLGTAHAALRDVDSAREAYLRAREIDRDHAVAKQALCDLELSAGNVGAAEEALEGADHRDPFVAARRVQIAARLGRLEDARKHLPSALQRPDGNNWPMKTAIEAMNRGGWRAVVTAMGQAGLERDPPDADLAVAWGLTASSWLVLSRTRVRRVIARGEVGITALSMMIEGTNSRWALRALLALHAPALRVRTVLWGSTGYALVTQGRLAAARRWLRDWRSRGELKPWMLVNVSLAFLAGGRFAESRAAVQAALALSADHCRSRLVIEGAWHAAREGDVARAEALLAEASPHDTVEKFAAELTQVLAVRRPESRLAVAREKLKLAEASQPGWRASPFSRRLMNETVWQVAKWCRTVRGWLWWLFRR